MKDKENEWSIQKSTLEASIAAKNATIEDFVRNITSIKKLCLK